MCPPGPTSLCSNPNSRCSLARQLPSWCLQVLLMVTCSWSRRLHLRLLGSLPFPALASRCLALHLPRVIIATPPCRFFPLPGVIAPGQALPPVWPLKQPACQGEPSRASLKLPPSPERLSWGDHAHPLPPSQLQPSTGSLFRCLDVPVLRTLFTDLTPSLTCSSCSLRLLSSLFLTKP